MVHHKDSHLFLGLIKYPLWVSKRNLHSLLQIVDFLKHQHVHWNCIYQSNIPLMTTSKLQWLKDLYQGVVLSWTQLQSSFFFAMLFYIYRIHVSDCYWFIARHFFMNSVMISLFLLSKWCFFLWLLFIARYFFMNSIMIRKNGIENIILLKQRGPRKVVEDSCDGHVILSRPWNLNLCIKKRITNIILFNFLIEAYLPGIVVIVVMVFTCVTFHAVINIAIRFKSHCMVTNPISSVTDDGIMHDVKFKMHDCQSKMHDGKSTLTSHVRTSILTQITLHIDVHSPACMHIIHLYMCMYSIARVDNIVPLIVNSTSILFTI